MNAASVISIEPNDTKIGHDEKMGFNGLHFDGSKTLLKMGSTEAFWVPIGQSAPYLHGGIPISNSLGGHYTASKIQLYIY